LEPAHRAGETTEMNVLLNGVDKELPESSLNINFIE
jgi:hypothetical protein